MAASTRGRRAIIAAVAASLAAAGAAGLAGRGGAGPGTPTASHPLTGGATPTVVGTAHVAAEAVPDAVRLLLRVRQVDPDMRAAVAGTERATRQVVAALVAHRVARRDIALSLIDLYEAEPGSTQPPRHAAAQRVSAAVREPAGAARALAAATAAGAPHTSVDGVEQELHAGREEALRRARATAWARALAEARQKAADAGGTLGPLRTIDEGAGLAAAARRRRGRPRPAARAGDPFPRRRRPAVRRVHRHAHHPRAPARPRGRPLHAGRRRGGGRGAGGRPAGVPDGPAGAREGRRGPARRHRREERGRAVRIAGLRLGRRQPVSGWDVATLSPYWGTAGGPAWRARGGPLPAGTQLLRHPGPPVRWELVAGRRGVSAG